MRKIWRSLIRIFVAVAAIILVSVLTLRVAITQPEIGSNPYPDGPKANPETLQQHVRFLTTDVFPRNHTHSENLNQAADHIRDSFLDAGVDVTEQIYQVGKKRFRNVLAHLGSLEKPRIIVGAHYDVYGEFPGADDNASGTAGLLELARVLASRSINFPVEFVAYSTEEPPFFGTSDMGSAVHAASLKDNNVEVRAMINLEMIGYFTEKQPAPSYLFKLLYPHHGKFILLAGRWEERPLISEIKRSFKGIEGNLVQSYCGPTKIVGADLSDHRNYWAQDIPAVMVTDTAFIRNPNYHKATDLPETLDYERMSKVVDAVANTIINLS